MEHKIFYSWQSDLPTQTNEQFIETALNNVLQKLKDDSSLDVNPTLDRDIANVPGSPDVAATILAKIEQSNIFVGDVSIINRSQSRNTSTARKIRLTSNPNVLVELGYALKALGPDKIVLINNLAFGRHEDLPFDFRHKHVVGYSLSQDEINGKYDAERQILETQLEQKLRQILLTLKKEPSQKPTPFDEAITAIRNSQLNQIVLINDFIDWMMNELEKSSPPFPKVEGKALDSVLASIDRTVGLVADFTRLSSVLASSNSVETLGFYKNIFERVIAKYNTPIGFSGSFSTARIQFYQFIGHELFISLISLLIELDKLEVLADILDEPLFAENTLFAMPQAVEYSYISMTGESAREIVYSTIDSLSEKLYQRHSEGELAKLTPAIRIVEADYFLSLRKNPRWQPVIHDRLLQPPKFLVRAFKKKYAAKLLKPLAVNNVDEIKSLLSLQSDRGFLRWRFNFNANDIGSE
ncbi:MAG TPA: hypothetical protein VN843_21075 [Anaerolineales bacterium]|nr:hypothetical protein [Anaerolineales bacterium]